MSEIYPGQIIYCDVDNTLIDHNNSPKKNTLKYLEYARSKGAVLYLWSQGGADYCRDIANQLGITHWFKAFLPKPEIVVDDLPIKAPFISKHIHPIQLIGLNWDNVK